MAYKYIGIDPSKGKEDITVDTSTTASDRACVDTAKITSRAEITAWWISSGPHRDDSL